jgi:transposase InsO family protein
MSSAATGVAHEATLNPFFFAIREVLIDVTFDFLADMSACADTATAATFARIATGWRITDPLIDIDFTAATVSTAEATAKFS